MTNFLFPDKNVFFPESKDFAEVARYVGYSKFHFPDKKISDMIKSGCFKLFSVLKPQAIFEEFALNIKKNDGNDGNFVSLPKNKIENLQNSDFKISFENIVFFSKDLGRNLKDCSSVYLTAATIGPQVDNVIRREQILNPAMAVILQGAGAMFIEKLVDYANSVIKDDAKRHSKKIKPRYSPGYGDVPLEIQKVFFNLLPCTKIGLTLMDSLIMAPEKSVTAFIGSF